MILTYKLSIKIQKEGVWAITKNSLYPMESGFNSFFPLKNVAKNVPIPHLQFLGENSDGGKKNWRARPYILNQPMVGRVANPHGLEMKGPRQAQILVLE